MSHYSVLRGVVALIAILAGATGCSAAAPANADAAAVPTKPFAIEVVDAATGRGVPLVELRTVDEVRYFTDSAGLVAFSEPGLMDRDVYFHISSHGYEFPKDGFGYPGKALRTTPGGKTRIEIKRINIAERLYRVTGQGIYRDSVMLGVKPPIDEPLLNAQVTGQDSVLSAIYRGKIFWFWGDTNKASYPLGNFSTTGATSELASPPGAGLDPAKGMNLRYFKDENGFTKKMAPLPEPGPVWLDGLMVLKDEKGQEQMFTHYSRMKSLGERLEHGLMRFNDEKEIFEKVTAYAKDALLTPRGHPLLVTLGDADYFYFATPYPMERVKTDWASVHDLKQYEAFTCLAPGSRYSKDKPALDRDKDGKLIWAWKQNTDYIDPPRQRELISAGHIRNTEAWIDTREVGTNKPITLHAGSVAWNEHRRKFVMIANQIMGTSMLGEVWYSEADKPEGPWKWAVKIVTHEKYSFYNPRHHPFFDRDGGRFLYFEGTYADLFSGAPFKTPRYDYNQMMYRLDLSDARLKLP